MEIGLYNPGPGLWWPFFLTILSLQMTEGSKLMLKNDLDCPGSRRFPAAVFMPLIDSAEKFRPSGLICQDNFAGTGCLKG